MTPEVSNVVGQGMRGLPAITRRKATATVRVPDGGTITIGGPLDSRTRMERLKVPVVGDIPLLGWLFRNQSAEKQARQVAVFITPTIVEEAVGEAALLSRLSHDRRELEPAGPKFQERLNRLLGTP